MRIIALRFVRHIAHARTAWFARRSVAVVTPVIVLALLAGQAWAVEQIPAQHAKQISDAAPSKPPIAPTKPRRVLIWLTPPHLMEKDPHKGYCIPYGAAAFRILGEKTGAYEPVVSDDLAMLLPEKIKQFDAIVLNNASGPWITPTDADMQKEAIKKTGADKNAVEQVLRKSFLDFVSKGGGVVSIHFAIAANRHWPEFKELFGATFTGHPWNEEIGVTVDEPENPLVAAFNGKDFRIADEIYEYGAPYDRSKLRVLLSLDPARSNMGVKWITRKDNDHALAWVKSYGKGRVFNTSFGHRTEIYWDPRVLAFYLAAVQFATGDLKIPTEQRPVANAPVRGIQPALDLTNRLRNLEESVGHLDAKLARQVNELAWFRRLGDIAVVDKVRFTGPPPHPFSNPPPLPGSNNVIVPALTFLPRNSARAQTVPLIVFVHGEIHGNVATDEDLHVVRELIEQGYAVIAPDYRGSSGYGGDYWRQIDYGGLEIEDVHAARAFMIERHREIDRRRVGIIGWSHGGMIALLTAFTHPDDYQAVYAGVPVSDLIDRVQRRGKEYAELFSAPYHLGKTIAEAPDEYRRRSPAFNANKLSAPLLLHANSNDEDVPLSEVQLLITALRQAHKDFELHVYTNAPGGHLFNRLDTALALESRAEIWRFLAKHLRPPKPGN